MSPVVHLATNLSFDDNYARAAMVRYCIQQNWAYELGDVYAKVDMFAKKPDGTYIGLELAYNACWTIQSTYPELCIHVPRRKWKTFYEQTKGVNIAKAERSYLIVFNMLYTRAAIMSFSSILEPLALFEENVLDIYDKLDIFVNVPTSYIQKYIDIPPEQKETEV